MHLPLEVWMTLGIQAAGFLFSSGVFFANARWNARRINKAEERLDKHDSEITGLKVHTRFEG